MKKGIKVLGIILLLCLCVIVSGCGKKPNENKTNTDSGNGNDAKIIDNFDTIVNNINFTSEVAGTGINGFRAVISDTDKITYKFESNGTEAEVSKQVTIGVSVKGLTLASNNDEGAVYVMTQNNEVYYVGASKTKEPVVEKLDVKNVSSFAALYTDLEGKGDYQTIVIIKTNEQKYYTDYKFSTDSSRSIKEIRGE